MTRRERALPLVLALGAFALALAQRPGWASSDTKVDLHVSPGRFLADVASVWTESGSLGHVQGGQYGGYLFPMGPFFALGHAAGLAPWLVHRLWLGALLALAAWGTVRLLDDLAGRPRGAAHVVAATMMVLNPYVVVFSARTSVTLLAYAVLPWLLLAVHRGVRRPEGWWWPALFALAVTASGGGVNAAVTAWVLAGPALLLGYEVLTGLPARAALAFALRTIVLTAVASLWWVGPILAQARYGIDFLEFTEQQGTIWGTTSVSESLRLMGYWVSYIGVGFHGATRPYFSGAGTLLYAPLVVAAMLLVPAL
ncbi:MAG TPA: alpha-(1-_3)-arabinofuranosyltransferase family protein, partial [Solirubrobacteraceae bacterium]|nr:alpha-(1->3)-arabinofuranosyltransferase family protein [Solirubrobacteraceae bacterium]